MRAFVSCGGHKGSLNEEFLGQMTVRCFIMEEQRADTRVGKSAVARRLDFCIRLQECCKGPGCDPVRYEGKYWSVVGGVARDHGRRVRDCLLHAARAVVVSVKSRQRDGTGRDGTEWRCVLCAGVGRPVERSRSA